jgi:alkane 1-monooxygenase
MGPAHTWDCHNGLAEALLFNLPRHAHHHLAPGLPGHALARSSEAPLMPTGYAGMVLLASLPPLWFRVMGPRLAAQHGH